jgi:N-acetylneuraminate lyase
METMKTGGAGRARMVMEGLVAAAHTPFHPDGSLNPDVVDAQASLLAGSGVRLVFITGSTGESASLALEERIEIYQAWAGAAGKHGLEVVAHVGGNCISDARRLSAEAAGLRFKAVGALSPSYFKPAGMRELVESCREIAAAADDLPFYYYDIPSMTGVTLSALEFLREGGRRITNLAGVKFTNPDKRMYAECLAYEEGRYDIAWGIDERLIEGLELGAVGAVGSTYNFAAPLYHELMESFHAGDLEHAAHLQQQSVWLVERMARVGYFGAAKLLMGWLGASVGPARLPLRTPDRDEAAELRKDLKAFRWLGGGGL